MLFGAAKLPKSLLNLLDCRRGLYILECVVVLFHGGFALAKFPDHRLMQAVKMVIKSPKFLIERSKANPPLGFVGAGRNGRHTPQCECLLLATNRTSLGLEAKPAVAAKQLVGLQIRLGTRMPWIGKSDA